MACQQNGFVFSLRRKIVQPASGGLPRNWVRFVEMVLRRDSLHGQNGFVFSNGQALSRRKSGRSPLLLVRGLFFRLTQTAPKALNRENFSAIGFVLSNVSYRGLFGQIVKSRSAYRTTFPFIGFSASFNSTRFACESSSTCSSG